MKRIFGGILWAISILALIGFTESPETSGFILTVICITSAYLLFPIPFIQTLLASYRQQLSQSELKELFILCNKTIEDQIVNDKEARRLWKWFKYHPNAQHDERSQILYNTLQISIADGVLIDTELLEIQTAISSFLDDHPYYLASKSDISTKLFKPIVTLTPLSKKQTTKTNASKLIAGDEYLMNYIDSTGNETDRYIYFVAYTSKQDGRNYIQAVCQLRDAFRTFRADRVKFLIHVPTTQRIELEIN